MMMCSRSLSSALRRVTPLWSASRSSDVHRQGCRCKSSSKNSWVMKSPFSDVEIPNISLSKYIFEAQEPFADKIAVVDGVTGASITHDQFRRLSIRLGSALTRLDIGHGDVFALVSPNCPEYFITFYGVASIGAVNTTINCTYTAEELALQLENSGASAVMTHSFTLPTVKEACKLCKGIRHIIVNGPAEDGILSLHELLKDDGTAFPHNVQIDPKEDVVALPFSSGTTGLPKGVMLTHYNIVANLQQILHKEINSLYDNSGAYQEVFMGILPYFHIYGIVPCMGLSLVSGSKTVTLPNFDPDLYINTLKQYKITFLHTVPPILGFLTFNNQVKPDHLESTHHVVSGAAPTGPALVNEFFRKFGDRIQFQEGYGMTETSPVTHLTPKGRLVIGSTGIVLPNTMAKIIDLDTGHDLGPNEGEGELCVKGPQVMKGYYKNEQATRDTIDKDGWLHTGDIARMDEGHNVYIVDRLKELIKVKGLQVAPAELEDLIRKHPDVQDVAVIGLPDDRAGEVPRAYVVLLPGSNVSEEAIADFVAKEVAPHKKLSGGVYFTDVIPKSTTGKILRRELKATALAQQYSS